MVSASLNRSYDTIGRPSGVALGSGYSVSYGYGSDGRLSGLSWKAAGVQDSATYGYLANSSLLSSVTLSSGAVTNYSYEPHRNLKTQVANRHNSTLISQYDYTYDAISRRTSMTTTGDIFSDTTSDMAISQPGQTSYTSNSLNQYTQISRDTQLSYLTHDDDGNLTDDGTRIFTWNGENRLISAAPKTPVDGDKKAEFVYDYMGRRVKKSLYSYRAASSWQLEKEILFVWDGWNLIEEKSGQSSRYFVWGLDLSRSLQGAGGVGGLVAAVDQGKEYLYFYDANGNVGQVVKSSDGSVAAHYEYDPYGNITRSYGEYAAENPFRFSTKFKDDETGLYYYGYRDYDPELGRWLNQDPIDEVGFQSIKNHINTSIDNNWKKIQHLSAPRYLISDPINLAGRINLYEYVNGNPVNLIDPKGLIVKSCWLYDNYPHNYLCVNGECAGDMPDHANSHGGIIIPEKEKDAFHCSDVKLDKCCNKAKFELCIKREIDRKLQESVYHPLWYNCIHWVHYTISDCKTYACQK